MDKRILSDETRFTTQPTNVGPSFSTKVRQKQIKREVNEGTREREEERRGGRGSDPSNRDAGNGMGAAQPFESETKIGLGTTDDSGGCWSSDWEEREPIEPCNIMWRALGVRWQLIYIRTFTLLTLSYARVKVL